MYHNKIMTTNNRITKKTTPIIHPAIIPTDEPSSSLLLCASDAPVIVLEVDTTEVVGLTVPIYQFILSTSVVIGMVILMVDTTEVVALSLVDTIEVVVMILVI